MKKALFFSAMCCVALLAVVCFAPTSEAESSTVVDGGLTYTLTESGESLTAQVTAWDKSVTAVTIKSSVTFEGQTYIVDSINSTLFKGQTILKSVVIQPNQNLNLPANLFQNCSGLETLIVGGGIESVPNYFCQNCSSLKTVELPASVTSIGANAFEKCSSLKNLELPSGLKTIGNSAFGGTATNYVPFTAVTIPDSVVSIGLYAFQNCKDVTSVVLGENLETVTVGAFLGTKYTSIHIPAKYTGNLNAVILSQVSVVTVDPNNPSYFAEDNIVYDKEKTVAMKCAPAMVGEVTVSTNVGEGAFNGSQVSKVTVADGVTSVGKLAFANSAVVEVIIPDSVTSMGTGVFQGASNLETLRLPASLKAIPDSFLQGCSKLHYTIPDSVETIGASAFQSMPLLEVTSLPSGLTTIGNNAFANCPKVTISSLPDSVTSVGRYAFQNTGIKSITIGEVNEVSLGTAPFTGSELESLTLNKVSMAVKDYSQVTSGATKLKQFNLGPDFGLWSFINGLAISLDGSTVYASQAHFYSAGAKQVTIPATVTVLDGPFTNVEKIYSESASSTIRFGTNVSFDKNCLKVLELPNVSMGTATKPTFASFTKLVSVKFTSIDKIPNGMFTSCSSLVDLSIGCADIGYSTSGTTKGKTTSFNNLSSLQMISFPANLSKCPQLTGLTLYDAEGNEIVLEIATFASTAESNAPLLAGKTFVKVDGKLTEVSSGQVILLKIVGDSRSYEVATKDEPKVIGDAKAPEGHTFGGWFTDANCTVAYNANGALSSDMTVYAKLVPIKYAVTIEGDGITIFSGDVAIQAGSEIDFGTELTIQLESRRGYISTVKLDGSILNGDSFKVPAKAFVISCEWTAIDYKVVCMDSDTAVKTIDGLRLGDVISLPMLQKDGFVGWTVNGMLLGAQYYVFFDDADSNGIITLSAKFTEDEKTDWKLTVTGGDGKVFWTTTNAIGTYGMITVLPDEFETVTYTVSSNGGYGIISDNCAMVYSIDGNDVTVTVAFQDVGKASEYDVSVAEIASGEKHGFKATVTAKGGYVDSDGEFAISYVYKTWNDTDKVWIYTTSGVTENVSNFTVAIPTDKKVSSVTGEFLLDNDDAMLVFGYATFSFKGTSATGTVEDVIVHSPVIMCVSEIQAVVGKP